MEDIRDELVHHIDGSDGGVFLRIREPLHMYGISPFPSVWAILKVVGYSTRPCPTGALVRVLIWLDQAQELGESRPASKELDKSCLGGALQLKKGWGLAPGHHVGCR